jgi:hypothetical protein
MTSPQRKRRLQALAVAPLGFARVAADERAVCEKVVREVLSARIAGPPLEQLERQGLRARDLAQRDECLADADERTRLATGVAKLTTKLEASLERLQRRPISTKFSAWTWLPRPAF